MNNHIPGYGGYIRTYQREHVTGKDIPAHIYEDIKPDEHSLMHNSTWRSVYTDTMKGYDKTKYIPQNDGGAKQRWEDPANEKYQQQHQQQQPSRILGTYSTTYRSTMNDNQQIPIQRTQSTPLSSTLHTSLAKPLLNGNHLSHAGQRVMTPPQAHVPATTYPNEIQQRINESIDREYEHRDAEHIQRQYETSGRAQAAIQQQVAQIPHAQNLLRATWGTSTSYQQDYGKTGTNPSTRYPSTSVNPSDLSRTSTTSQLFLGSTKGSIRIPNYSGFVPHSHINNNQLQGTSNINQDHIILTSYRHDMPGYGGYAIGKTHGVKNVANDRGPRTPRGKRQVDQGLQASLILDSMH